MSNNDKFNGFAGVRRDIAKEQAEQRNATKPELITRPKCAQFPADVALFAVIPVVTCLISILSWTGKIPWLAEDSLSLVYKEALSGHPYRFVTYMFVHAGRTHLMNNMLSYICVGVFVYRYLNRRDFFMSYFFSGFIGGVVSALINVQTSPDGSTIGASAAVFGLLGTYIAILLSRRGNIWFSIFVVFLFWSMSSVPSGGMHSVDWAAHLGGFITGLMLGTSMADRRGVRYTKKAAKLDNRKVVKNVSSHGNVMNMEEWKKKNHWEERKRK